MSIVDPVCTAAGCQRKTIERLTADLNESERQTRAQLKRVLQRDERIAELEAALRGYVKATTGQESATVTFPMALEAESIADKLRRKGYTKPKHSAYHDAVDGYCGKRSSKAGLQAGETEHE